MPPDIVDYQTSTDMVVREGSNVTLRCGATGSPPPVMTWRRENGEPISLSNGVEGELYYSYFAYTSNSREKLHTTRSPVLATKNTHFLSCIFHKFFVLLFTCLPACTPSSNEL